MRRGSYDQNVELSRRALEAFNTRDVDGFLAYIDPGCEFHPVLATIGGVSVYHGHEGVRSWFEDFEEVWGKEIHVDPEAYFAFGDQTLLFYVLRARGRQSGVEVTMRLAQVTTWRENLIVYAKVYTQREEALSDLGVSENALQPIAP
jgi:ketosteroid isomerase-like protein